LSVATYHQNLECRAKMGRRFFSDKSLFDGNLYSLIGSIQSWIIVHEGFLLPKINVPLT